jgi:hypothetical protein
MQIAGPSVSWFRFFESAVRYAGEPGQRGGHHPWSRPGNFLSSAKLSMEITDDEHLP